MDPALFCEEQVKRGWCEGLFKGSPKTLKYSKRAAKKQETKVKLNKVCENEI